MSATDPNAGLSSVAKIEISTTGTKAPATDYIIPMINPFNGTLLIVLASIGTVLVLLALIMLTFAVLLLCRKCGCLKKRKDGQTPIVDLDEQDSTTKQTYKRHSAISQTNEEVEMLKLDPQITNQSHPVPASHDERGERREDMVPLMLSQLPTASNGNVTTPGGDSLKRYSWGQRNTSFRLGQQERDHVVTGLARIAKQEDTRLEDTDVESQVDTQSVTTDYSYTSEAPRINPKKLATVHQNSQRGIRNSGHHYPKTNAIHYDVPKLNKPITVEFVGKGDVPLGMVQTENPPKPELKIIVPTQQSAQVVMRQKSNPTSPRQETRPATTTATSQQQRVATPLASLSSRHSSAENTPTPTNDLNSSPWGRRSSATTPATPNKVFVSHTNSPNVSTPTADSKVPPWERYSPAATPTSTLSHVNYPDANGASPNRKSRIPPPTKPKPKLQGKTMSLPPDVNMRQKDNAPASTNNNLHIRATISEDTPSPLYYKKNLGQPDKVATVKTRASYNSFREHLDSNTDTRPSISSARSSVSENNY